MTTYSANPDLEAYFLQDNNDRDSNANQAIVQSPQGPIQNLRNSLNFSLKFNFAKLSVSLSKIVAATAVLATSVSCTDSKVILVYLMIVHDVLNSLVTFMTIRLVRTVNREIDFSARLQQDAQRQEQEGYEINYHRQGERLDDIEGNENMNRELLGENTRIILDRDRQQRNIRALAFARETAKRQRLIAGLTSIVETFFFLLFIYAQLALFIDKSTQCVSTSMDHLILAYVILAYMWILSPVILILLTCLCLPLLLFIVCLFGKPGQISANRRIIDKLPVQEFSPNLPGNHECAICMVDYKEKDRIVQFKCSPLHHFHEECIKRWLGVSGQCPICRMRVEDMEAQRQGNE